MAQPTFSGDVGSAYEQMVTKESANDFMVMSFGENLELNIRETGKGGLASVKEHLSQLENEVAVAVFRVTAVDDRGVTVSYRTKIIHVVWVGPSTPAMKRARVAGYTKTLREPFQGVNLHLQLDDLDDLDEASVEKELRSSGGAHAPTGYDFANSA